MGEVDAAHCSLKQMFSLKLLSIINVIELGGVNVNTNLSRFFFFSVH